VRGSYFDLEFALVVRLDSVGLRYGDGPEILKDVSFHLQPGSLCFLTGPSGAGKTSLLRPALVLPLLGLLALSSTGCSMFAPTDKNVIGQANQVHTSLEPAIIRDAQVQRYMDAIGERIVKGAIEYNEEGKTAKATL
jgi:ABC-type Mn2+/Zn2+ transport system ATPase subunit